MKQNRRKPPVSAEAELLSPKEKVQQLMAHMAENKACGSSFQKVVSHTAPEKGRVFTG